MKIITMLKFLLKLLIFSTFIGERFFYYKQFKAVESDKKNIHHELVGGWEIDFSKVDPKYSDHPLFKLPYTREITSEMRKYIIHKFNLNQTASHFQHTHSKDSVHTFSNKVIDIDVKFKFYFLTAYDLIVTTVLIFSFFSESKIGGIIYFLDIFLKNYCMFYEPSFNHQVMNLINWQFSELWNYLMKNKSNFLKILNFIFTFLYLFVQFVFGKKKHIDEGMGDGKACKEDKSKKDLSLEIQNENKDVNYGKVVPKAVPLVDRERCKNRAKSPGGRDRRQQPHY